MIRTESIFDREYFKTVFSIIRKTQKVEAFRRFLSVFSLILGVFYLWLSWEQHFIEGTGVACTVIGILFFLLAFFGNSILNYIRETRLQKAVPGSARYSFSEEGVAISSEVGEGKYKWDAFDMSGTESHFLWLRRKFDRAYILADRNKLSAEEAAQLRKWFCAARS